LWIVQVLRDHPPYHIFHRLLKVVLPVKGQSHLKIVQGFSRIIRPELLVSVKGFSGIVLLEVTSFGDCPKSSFLSGVTTIYGSSRLHGGVGEAPKDCPSRGPEVRGHPSFLFGVTAIYVSSVPNLIK